MNSFISNLTIDMKVLAKKSVNLDIMLKGHFVKQLKYEFFPLFVINGEDIKKFVEEKMPSLIGKAYNINFSTQKV